MNPLLRVEDLKVYFGSGSSASGAVVAAVDGVSFEIGRGKTLGLVGESGSGKTTVGRAILRTIPLHAGSIRFQMNGESVDVSELTDKELRIFRREHMQLIFQDPYASLSPRMTVRDIIAEPLECQRFGTRAEIDARVRDVAAKCRLNLEFLRRFPHAFSGGQRQRICIARALAANPEFIVCDEAVSALDVSIQADIINLLMDLQAELGLTYLFIAHDLSIVAQISSEIAVMYVGKLVEKAPAESIFRGPMHPYTKALISAIPRVDPDKRFEPMALAGEIPNPMALPPGCRFSTRCPFARDACQQAEPEWREIATEHFVACHFAEELALAPEGRQR
ncbi:ABC transporter ATP-binding protein [Pseudoxanthobacter sp. M-2]|uniref:ABC transporter ATP-binding protein n=1 Tax=Pseudoxanthobacter sp. M-2 TaxID=3078754 RepID=UPI0038FC45BB